MSSVRELRASLVKVSRRYTRVAHEVEDLAHDLILSALRRGSLDSEAFLRSANGAARRHGAFLARSAGRRRAREAHTAIDLVAGAHTEAEPGVDEGAPLSVLSPALRTTLYLLLSGLEKAELRVALGVTDAALRKRFQALREYSPLARPELPGPARTAARSTTRRSQVGLLPRLALAVVGNRRAPRVLAVTDPDGHGVIFTEVLTPSGPAATPSAPASQARARTKGKLC